MTQKPMLLAVAGALALAPVTRGAILVTEFMPNPSGTDADREWIEIYNSGDAAVDLSDYKVGDEEAVPTDAPGGEGMFEFPEGTVMQPGEVFVIAVNATGFQSLYGFKPDFETNAETDATVPNLIRDESWATGSIALANTGDHALIVNGDDEIVDGANFGDATKFFDGPALAANESMERVPANVDTDSGDDWVVRASGEATPGAVTVPEPAGLGLVAFGAVGLLGRRARRGRRGE